MNRHQSVRDIMAFFEFGHLPVGLPQERAAECFTLACAMVATLPDSAELTVGLRKLLEAKDCFVRAASKK